MPTTQSRTNPMKPTTIKTTDQEELRRRAEQLGLWGVVAHWDKIASEPWLSTIIDHEEDARARRSLERRLRNARLGPFKPMADFDWLWPTELDRELVDELFQLRFVTEPANVIIIGQNGAGKTMLAQNLAYQAILLRRCLSRQANYSTTWQRKTRAQRSPGDYGTIAVRSSLSSMSSVISPPPADMPSFSLRSLPGDTSASQSSSLPTKHLPNGAKCFPTPPVSSRSLTGSFTKLRFSKSTPIRTD